MGLPDSCNTNSCTPSSRQGICPSGWHVASRDDFVALFDSIQNHYSTTNVAKYLKTYSGSPIDTAWDNSANNYGDTLGFNALPTGLYYHPKNYYEYKDDLYSNAFFWTSDTTAVDTIATQVNILGSIYPNNATGFSIDSISTSKTSGLPVRCVYDN